MKTPEQYFQEQVFDSDALLDQKEVSDQEQAFIQKYLGELAENLPDVGPQARQTHAFPPPAKEQSVDAGDDEQTFEGGREEKYGAAGPSEDLRRRQEVQLVSFFMGQQEYALPIDAVQEVIKYIQPSRLPTAPAHVEGVINLRRKITPVVDLPGFMRIKKSDRDEHRFMVVCRHSGFQVALLVERIATMYRISDSDIEWNVDSALGGGSGVVEALIKNRERIISVLSIEKIVQHLLGDHKDL